MNCPTLKELPSPPKNKTGWPWTEESFQASVNMPDGRPWPRISIITPSYNQGQFLEETIRSVLLQGYPDLEYIIIDGESKDNSAYIIKKYEPWLAYWVSETDSGQSQAVNKGFRHCTGEITTWLNSDDVYHPNTFSVVARELDKSKKKCIIVGNVDAIDKDGILLKTVKGQVGDYRALIMFWKKFHIPPQPSTFFCKFLLDEFGLLDEKLTFGMDYDLFLRFIQRYKFYYVNVILSSGRLHSKGKMVKDEPRFVREWTIVSKRHWGGRLSPLYYYYAITLINSNLRNESNKLYKLALQNYNQKEYLTCIKYLVYGVVIYPLYLFNRNYMALVGMLLLGKKHYKFWNIFISKNG